MGDNEDTPHNTATNPPSCPYPLVDHFPVPATSESSAPENDTTHSNTDVTIPVGMLSPYYRDRIILPEEHSSLIANSNSENTNRNVNRNSLPSAPHMNGAQIAEQYAPAIGFTNLLSETTDISPSVPPPSYDDLFETNNLTPPRPSPRNGSINSIRSTRPATPPTAIVVPRSERVSSPRVITHPRVQVIGTPTYVSTSNESETCAAVFIVTVVFVLLVVLSLILLK